MKDNWYLVNNYKVFFVPLSHNKELTSTYYKRSLKYLHTL